MQKKKKKKKEKQKNKTKKQTRGFYYDICHLRSQVQMCPSPNVILHQTEVTKLCYTETS